MDFQELVHARYSCRSFSPQPVEREKLERVLEAARVAPTAKNKQPQHYLVVSEPEGLTKMDEVTPCRFGAPLVLALCYDKTRAHTTGYGYMSADMDCTISLTHAMLAAKAEGLESVWLLNYDREAFAERFCLPEHLASLCLLPIGYASETAAPGPMHEASLPLEDMVSFEQFS